MLRQHLQNPTTICLVLCNIYQYRAAGFFVREIAQLQLLIYCYAYFATNLMKYGKLIVLNLERAI